MNIKNLCIVTVTCIASLAFTASAHDSHTHSAPWQACENKQKTAQCSFTNGDEDLFKGSCQMFSETLMCVRNQPIIHADALCKKADKQAEKTGEK